MTDPFVLYYFIVIRNCRLRPPLCMAVHGFSSLSANAISITTIKKARLDRQPQRDIVVEGFRLSTNEVLRMTVLMSCGGPKGDTRLRMCGRSTAWCSTQTPTASRQDWPDRAPARISTQADGARRNPTTSCRDRIPRTDGWAWASRRPRRPRSQSHDPGTPE